MAGVCSKADDKEFDHFMTCCLGDHPLQDPRLLPCQHSFCTGCIKSKIAKERNDFVCPKCQLTIPLTEKEVDQLAEDVLYHVIQETKSKTYCVCCKFEDKNVLGTFQCLDCADILCDQCQRGHTKTSFTLSHTVVKITEIQEGKCQKDVQAERAQLCPVHSKANKVIPLELYCEECKCLICHQCAFTGHQPKGHKCESLEKIHDEKVKAIHDYVITLQDVKGKAEEFAAVLEQELGQNREQKEQLENEVHDRATHFINIIEKVKEDILKNIKGHFDKEDTSIQIKLVETKNKITRIDSHISYTKTFLKHSLRSKFLQHEEEMIKRLEHQKQQKMDNNLTTNRLELGQPQYEKTKVFIQKAFGKIHVKTNALKGTATRLVPRVMMEEPVVLFSTDQNELYSYGLAVNEKNNVISVYGSTIQMYDSDGKAMDKFTCNQLQYAWNVVPRGDTLCVSTNNGSIFVIDYQGNVKEVITIPEDFIDTGSRHAGLAVDAEYNVYISSHKTNNIYKSKLNETNAKVFIPRGKYLDLKQPWYLCITPSGELVVSNRGSHTVQVYDKQGRFLWQYRGQGDMALNDPRGVCCDTDGYLYIADRGNNRIQVIKDELLQGCVKVQGLANPCGIDIDKNNNIVCGYDYGKAVVKVKVWQ